MKRFYLLLVVATGLIACESAAAQAPDVRIYNFLFSKEEGTKHRYQIVFDGAEPSEKLTKAAHELIKRAAQSPKATITENPFSKKNVFYDVEPPQGEKLPKLRLYSTLLLGCDKSGIAENAWWEYEVVVNGALDKEFVKGFFQYLIASEERLDESKLKLRYFWKSTEPRLGGQTYTVRVLIVRNPD